MAFAMHLFNAGHRDQAVFWLYAGQLRARYERTVAGETAQVFTIFMMGSESINAYAMSDVRRFSGLVEKVLAWDDATFVDWAWEHGASFRDPGVHLRRAQAREGLGQLVKDAKSKRADYEKRGRDHLAAQAPKGAAPSGLSMIPSESVEPRPPAAPAQRSTLYVQPGREAERLDKTTIVAREAPIAGKDTQYWARRYYEWLERAQRNHTDVRGDATGALCSRGQGEPVWFLTNYKHGIATRACSVPPNVFILIPVFEILLATNLESSPSAECEEIVFHARKSVAESRGIRLTIDGKELKSLLAYEGSTGCYERDTAYKKRQRVAAHGYWIFLSPLPPGTHRIQFAGQARLPNYAHDVTYVLTVSSDALGTAAQ